MSDVGATIVTWTDEYLQEIFGAPRRFVRWHCDPSRSLRALGGCSIPTLFVARSKPVEFRASYEARFLEVVSSESTPTPFDQTNQVRALDLDRGLLVLGKQRMQCFVGPELLADVTAVGIRARVRGQLYRPLLGKAFVLADSVEPQANPDDD